MTTTSTGPWLSYEAAFEAQLKQALKKTDENSYMLLEILREPSLYKGLESVPDAILMPAPDIRILVGFLPRILISGAGMRMASGTDSRPL
jgi:predicted thioredoxin/glutaredoxin